uniref:Uncharacterized protein n=1 Tax=Oryza rufipogon TaxID=4529 RepID=A0A0E0N247_ORYRU
MAGPATTIGSTTHDNNRQGEETALTRSLGMSPMVASKPHRHQWRNPPEPEPEPSLSLLLLREFVPADEPDTTKHEKPTPACTSTNPISTTVMPPSLTATGTDTSDHHATATASVFNGLGRTSSSPSNVADDCCYGLRLHQAQRSKAQEHIECKSNTVVR